MSTDFQEITDLPDIQYRCDVYRNKIKKKKKKAAGHIHSVTYQNIAEAQSKLFRRLTGPSSGNMLLNKKRGRTISYKKRGRTTSYRKMHCKLKIVKAYVKIL